MKNLKKWSIIGASLGSMLIIVALFAMVSIGSNDTYALESCECPDGYDKRELLCAKDVKISQYCTCPKGYQRIDNNCLELADEGGYTGRTQPCRCPLGTEDISGPNCYGGTKVVTVECQCSGEYRMNGSGMCVPKTDNPSDDESSCTKVNESCTLNGKNGTCKANTSGDGFTCQVTTTPAGGGDDDKPNNPTTPSGGDDGSGGNGGNNGGSGNSGGNSGGNAGSNTSNANRNPSTVTKTPLVIAIIGIISAGMGSVAYFNSKKEINTEI